MSHSRAATGTSVAGAGVADDPKGPLGLNLLFSPPDPQIDLVFVHGLGGGSRKTWSKSSHPSHYWPKEWLPKDEAFKNVRIHSYGYDSNYLKLRQNRSNIHQLGMTFMNHLAMSPHIGGCESHIVAVGHSMGGLVIKQAYLLARGDHDPKLRVLASRFAAMFFLATPHRGSLFAKLLKKIIAFTRGYIGDLQPNSTAIQDMNHQFRGLEDLRLMSFIETESMNPFSDPIVDAGSATLNHDNERTIYMDANHRSICKFSSPSDHNYILLRNALAMTMAELTKSAVQKQTRLLKEYLTVPDDFDEDFRRVCEARIENSCKWIFERDVYKSWENGEDHMNRVLWIRGGPATGKSVLAGSIIKHLRDSKCPVSYFFFKHGDKSKTRLGTCFQTLAFQMASSIPEARKTILQVQSLNKHDERGLWNLIFSSGILRTTFSKHYWVIDALDECDNPSFFLSSAIAKLDVPHLRILITSRNTTDLAHDFSAMPAGTVRDFSISVADTLPDLELLVESQSHALKVVGPDDRAGLVKSVLDKSRGSFLWTLLVLRELASCYSMKEVNQVLQEVPRDMEPLYKRILDSMSRVIKRKDLAKAVLSWVTCAERPMSTKQLSEALELDLHDTFPHLEESVSALCGQLVMVDTRGQVQMVHEAAREILLSKRLDSEFMIDTTKAHTQLAKACVAYLAGEEMRPLRSHRRHSSHPVAKRLEFAAYACDAYSYHLARSDPQCAELFLLVHEFLKANVLSWIETLARTKRLGELSHASKQLRTYADACSTLRSPLDPKVRNLRQWAADLARIPAVFATALTKYPYAIYSVIPPFCPTDSAIRNTRIPGRKLMVQTGSNKAWDDRLACIAFREGQASSMCYSEEFLAVGLTNGKVAVHYATTYQKYTELDHKEPVMFIAIRCANLMATCGMRSVKVWDTDNQEVLYQFESPPRPLAMEFDGDTLLVAGDKGILTSWHIGHDASANVRRLSADWSGDTQAQPRPVPLAIAISVSQAMLAIAYNGQPIALWDLERDEYIGTCGKQTSSGGTSSHVVVTLVFNPNPSIGPLLAVAYLDGDLALLDTSQSARSGSSFADLQQQQVACYRADCQTLAASPSGQLLAAGGRNGIITILEFDTLQPLYRVRSPDTSFIKQLTFARNGDGNAGTLRLADIRASQCTIWEPEILLRDRPILGGGMDDSSSGSSGDSARRISTASSTTTAVAIIPGSQEESLPVAIGCTETSLEVPPKITAVAVHTAPAAGKLGKEGPADGVVFAGGDDGTVSLYDARTATYLRTLYSHKSPVRLLKWCPSRSALLSVDASNWISLHVIRKPAGEAWSSVVPDELFSSRLESEDAVFDALLDDDGNRFVLSTRESDYLFAIGSVHMRNRSCKGLPDVRKWLRHPLSSHRMMCVDGATIGIYQWSDLSPISSYSLSLGMDKMELKNAALYRENNTWRLILEFSEKNGPARTCGLAIFDANTFTVRPTVGNSSNGHEHSGPTVSAAVAENQGSLSVAAAYSVAPLDARLGRIMREVTHVIGLSDSGKLVFIDGSSWVCSVDLTQHGRGPGQDDGRIINEFFRHFFVPLDWFAGRRRIVCAMSQKDIILTRSGDLAIIKGSFEHCQRVVLE